MGARWRNRSEVVEMGRTDSWSASISLASPAKRNAGTVQRG
jgi:hypothetical protein